MKKFSITLFFTLFYLLLIADVPGPYIPEIDVTIVLPENANRWKFYYRIYRSMTMSEYLNYEHKNEGDKPEGLPIGECKELVGKLNKVTLQGGNYKVPNNIKIFARDSVSSLETNQINEFRGDIEKFIFIDSISEQTLFFHSYNKIEYQIYLNKLKRKEILNKLERKEIKPTKIKPDTGSYNNSYRTEIKYYKAGSPNTTNFTTLFIPIIITIGSLILFIVRRYYKYKRD